MRKPTTTAAAVQTPAAVHVIEPTGVYFRDDVVKLLRLPVEAIREEIKAGRLRVSEVRGRYRFLGAWLLEWIQRGEVGRLPIATEGYHAGQD